jgi:hypothetical protein
LFLIDEKKFCFMSSCHYLFGMLRLLGKYSHRENLTILPSSYLQTTEMMRLSSGMLCHVGCERFTDMSKARAASTFASRVLQLALSLMQIGGAVHSFELLINFFRPEMPYQLINSELIALILWLVMFVGYFFGGYLMMCQYQDYMTSDGRMTDELERV